MKIGIISDTHDHLRNLKKAADIFIKGKIQLLVHCGDWVSPFTIDFFASIWENSGVPVKSVWGNNKGDLWSIFRYNYKSKNPIEFAHQHVLEFEIEQKKAIVYHGQDDAITKNLLKSQLYDLVFTGHTHQSLIETVGKTLHINPGTICGARESEIVDDNSIAIYESIKNKAKIINL